MAVNSLTDLANDGNEEKRRDPIYSGEDGGGHFEDCLQNHDRGLRTATKALRLVIRMEDSSHQSSSVKYMRHQKETLRFDSPLVRTQPTL